MRALERFVSLMTRPRLFAPVGRRVLTPLDRLLRRSRLAPSRIGTELPLCFIHTVGRRSGKRRWVPLVYVEADSDGIVVVATNWGTRSHPGWSYNLDAEPRTSYLIDGSETTAAARRASADEFALYWRRFVERWPNYDGYRRRLQREVRMYVLTPQPA